MENNLQQLYNNFINECRYSACLSPETIRGYRAVFNLLIKVIPEIESTDQLTREMLTEYFKRIENRNRKFGKKIVSGVKKSTIKTHWSKLNVFFKWLRENNYIDENPLKGIKPPKVSYDDYKRLKNEEINRIYSAIVSYSESSLIARRDTLMVSLLLYLGVRKGEFISLQVKDIDFSKKLITIRGETSKSKKTKILPIHPTLLLHIKDYFEERKKLGYKTECLIISSKNDKGLSREGLKHWVNKIIKISGVKFHLHQFRHTFACKLTEGGTPTASLQKLMGHICISMTAKYTRSLSAENMNEEISRISI
jgi:site-specific recombinase XerD